MNNISTVLRNDGTADIDAQELNSGFVFPRGSGKTAVFESGFLWGAKVAGQVRVGGSTYRTGLQPGKITSPGVSEDPSLAKNRIYRVRPDYLTADLSSQALEEGTSADAIRTQLQTDWNEWPAGDGAPFVDVNHNGVYDPGVDTAGISGAAETVWFVCNDNNAAATASLYGSSPLGIEMQVTAWAYTGAAPAANLIFKKYVLINKSGVSFDSMFVSQWSDPDVGNSTDDFAGCDTTLDLVYVYNAAGSDAVYDPLPPPAVGYKLVEGPAVPSPGDTAVRGGRKYPGLRNLRMTASYYFARGDASVTDPPLGSPNGAPAFYNFFQGRIGATGNGYVDPNTSGTTRFPLAGDPVNHSGWVDGNPIPAGDRRVGLACGPFGMSPGDTQEVIVGELAAGAVGGMSNLSAITLLKSEASSLPDIPLGVSEREFPRSFALNQNYPNPFNPQTTIAYVIAAPSRVTVRVFDLLGREVRTLVDRPENVGARSTVWDGKNSAGRDVGSGVYFYRIEANPLDAQKAPFAAVRKMLLVR